jgi:hypothetical protein
MTLAEAFHNAYLSPFFLKNTVGKSYEVFVNPSKKEISEFKDGYRFVANAKDKKLYIFNVHILHQLAANDLWDSIDLYESPHILTGTIVGNKIEDLVPFGEDAGLVYKKKFFKDMKEYDWSWLGKYFDVTPFKRELEKK